MSMSDVRVKNLVMLIMVLFSFFVIFSLAGLASAETYQFQLKWGSSGAGNGEFNYASRVAVAPSGSVYVTDHSNNRIQKFDMNGGYIGQWGSAGPGESQFNNPMGIAVDTFGNVYVADTQNNRIQKFDSDGGFIRQWGGPGGADGEFTQPFAVAASASGHIYVAEDGNRVQKFDLDGSFITKWGSSGTNPGQFSGPRGIAADTFGNVYVSEYFNNRIQKFTSDGGYIRQWGTAGPLDGQFNMPYGLAADAAGNVFVVDHGNGRVQKFDPEGNFISRFGSGGSGDGQLSFPTGVAVNAYGSVYVADMYNNRVQKFYLPVCVAPPSGLAGWWTGDGNANDISGGHNGTLMNGATYEAGRVGQAFSFNGANDYVAIPAHVSMNLGTEFTVDFWMQPAVTIDPSDPLMHTLLFKGDSNLIDIANGDGRIEIIGPAQRPTSVTSTWTAGQWYHIAVTFDSGGYKIFVNGLQEGSSPDTYSIFGNMSELDLGGGFAPDTDFNGLIDEIEVFTRALSDQEIIAIYNAGTAGKCKPCIAPPSGMVAWWAGDDNAEDMLGISPGTLMNGATFADGKVGRAFSFSGPEASVTVPASSSWAFGTADFAIDFWAYSTSFAARRPLINNRKTGAGDNMWAIEIYGSANMVEFHSGSSIYLQATNPLLNSNWNHIAVTRSAGTLSIYINGTLSGSAGVGSDFSQVNDLQIGRDIMSGNQLSGGSFQGLIDEVEIHNRALTAAEIAAIYNAGGGGMCKACTAPPSGIVAWWKADGNAVDAVGTNHGTLQGGMGYVPGKVGQAFSFNGVNNYVQTPPTNSIPFGGAARTLDFWMKTDDQQDGKAPIVYGAHTSESAFYVSLFGGKACIGYWGGGPLEVCGSMPVTNGEWHYIALTYESGEARLFVDGVLDAGVTRSYNTSLTETVLIGGGVSVSYYSGFVDEIGIYDRALSAPEIAALYNAGSTGKCFNADTTPNGFIFEPVTGATPNVSYNAGMITVTGINVPVEVTVSGGEYSIGCTGTFTTAPGTVVNGNTVCVRQMSSPDYSTTTTTTLTIGDGSADFNVTTMLSHTLNAVAVPSGGKTFSPSSWIVGDGGNIVINIEANSPYYFISATDTCGEGGTQNGTVDENNMSYSVPSVTIDCSVTVQYAEYLVRRLLAEVPTGHYLSIQAAYESPISGEEIQAQQTTFPGDLNLNLPVSLTLRGGYDSGFVPNAGGFTTIGGMMTVIQGTVTVENITVHAVEQK
ncbi:MAG: hypothetical protein C0402_06890 [Thermodesulfovibrio sp.]|nr:hypothetical protein [Thermodesulfovibrio sp.]